MNSNTKTILGLIAAGAAGVAIGMLLAPEKGSDLRKSLKANIDDLTEKLGDLLAEGKEMAAGKAEELSNKAGEIQKDANTAIEHGKQVLS